MKLAIEKVIYGGQGLARVPVESGPHGGMRAFVPFTLPGEIVEAEIVEEHRGYGVAEVRQIERASEFRTAPPCPYFGTCGGCQLQHGAYPFQVEMKCEMLAESLTRAGIRELPEIISLTGAPLGYRNRIRLQVQTQPNFAIGYRRAKSHRMTAIDQCPIASPLLARCITAVRGMGLENAVPTDVPEMEMFTNHDESELLLTVWTRRRSPLQQNPYAVFFNKLQKKLPQLTGAAVLTAEKEHDRATRPLMQWGRENLLYRVAGRDYTVSPGSFFQVNASLLDAFAGSVVDSESGELAWDLYAGVGLFSFALTERFQRVLAVESSPSAGKDLRKNLQNTNAAAVSSTTLDFLQKAGRKAAQHRESSPDLVVLDPPRAGAGIEVCRLLALCHPRRVVYVSCDPATLGRDLATLIQSGYRLHRLQLVDMFPQTGHLETIATLDRY